MLDPHEVAALAVEAATNAVAGLLPSKRAGTVETVIEWQAAVRMDGDGGLAYAQVVSDPPAPGQRVVVEEWPDGRAFVVGAWSGERRLLGRAYTDVAQTAISTEVDLDDMGVEFTVTQPNRLIVVHAHVAITPANPDRRATLRVQEFDDEASADVLIGRPAEAQNSVAARLILDGEVEVGDALDPVDTGDHEWRLTLSLAGGGTCDTNSDLERATISVYDAGPVSP